MAKKKSGKSAKKNIFVMRGTEEYQKWMNEFADHLGLPMTIAVQESMKEKAERLGFRAPPKRY